MLVNDGILSDARLAQALMEMKLLDEEVLLKYLGAQFRKEAITQQELTNVDIDVVKLVPEEVARQHRIIAAERHGRKLIVATADPLNVVALDDLRRATGLEVDFKIGSSRAIAKAIDECYRGMESTNALDDVPDLGTSN